MPRYKYAKKIYNDSEFYEFLRQKKGLKTVKQYGTIVLHNPGMMERASIDTITYTWGYGDRLYKLANTYYNDPEYWWVIAWWNGRPTEADIPNGTVLQIPINLEYALQLLESF